MGGRTVKCSTLRSCVEWIQGTLPIAAFPLLLFHKKKINYKAKSCILSLWVEKILWFYSVMMDFCSSPNLEDVS